MLSNADFSTMVEPVAQAGPGEPNKSRFSQIKLRHSKLDGSTALPTITIRPGKRHENADAGLAAMFAADVPFFVRDKTLVKTCIIKAKTTSGELVSVPAIIPVTQAMLGRAMGQTAIWQTETKTGAPRRADPPNALTEQALGMVGDWPFHPLIGVISTPTLRADGSLLSKEGYDRATGYMLLALPPMPDIPDAPTKTNAEDALGLLMDLLDEIPFADDASMSVGVSMLMTPVLRPALSPAVPMHIATAPESGSGKSYLADISSAIATGDRCYVQSVREGGTEETEKKLVSSAIAGYPIIALDNCNGGHGLSGDFLCQITERPGLAPRILGKSQNPHIPNMFTVFATGNNVVLKADMVRRSIVANLDANMDNPTERVFRGSPVETVLADRGRFVAAVLTIARAYIVAGRPGKLNPLPSYRGWSDIVRSALVWLGMEDPVSTQEALRVEDPARAQLAAVFGAWATEIINPHNSTGYLATQLIEAAGAIDHKGEPACPLLKEALDAVAHGEGEAGSKLNAKRLSWWLRNSENRVSGAFKLSANRSDSSRVRWVLTATQTA